MHQLAVYGGVFRSQLDFPELDPAPADREPDWILEATPNAAPRLDAVSLGSDKVYGSVRVHAYVRPDRGYSLVFDDTGRFDISSDNRRIIWYGATDRLLDAGRADILGRVLPLALHGSGILSLHASAIALGSEGVAFLAPKLHGKSTTATAMLELGARLITDDVLPVMISEPPICLPGVPRLRLWRDSVRVMIGDEAADALPDARKLRVDDLRADQVQTLPVRFSTAYVLWPVSELPDGQAVARTPLNSIEATMAIVEHAKLSPLLAGEEAGAQFTRAASVASAISVFDLRITRDFNRLGEVAATLARWHNWVDPRAIRG